MKEIPAVLTAPSFHNNSYKYYNNHHKYRKGCYQKTTQTYYSAGTQVPVKEIPTVLTVPIFNNNSYKYYNGVTLIIVNIGKVVIKKRLKHIILHVPKYL